MHVTSGILFAAYANKRRANGILGWQFLDDIHRLFPASSAEDGSGADTSVADELAETFKQMVADYQTQGHR